MEEGFDQNMIFAVVGVLMAAITVAGLMMRQPASQKQVHNRAMKVMSSYSSSSNMEEQLSSLRKAESDPLIGQIFQSLPSLKNVRGKLDKLGGTYTLKMFATRMLITFVITFTIFKVMMGMNIVLAILICLLLSYLLPNMGINRRFKKRQKMFLKLMPDALDLIVRGLRSGLPVTESMQTVAAEVEDPVRSVFLDISSAVKVGKPFEDALHEASAKLELNEFNFFTISIALQRETGGNLAEILENLSETVRARTMMKLKVLAISSEARASSYIVGGLPFIVSAVLLFMSPNYMDPLIEELSGNIALGVAVFMFSFGMFVIRKMASMEV